MILPLAIVLAAAIPADFCKALSADSVAAFAPLAADPEKLRQSDFQSVRDLVAHYGNIDVSACEATSIDRSTVAVDIVGTGLTRNASRQRTAIPRRWYLSLSDDGHILFAEDETRHILSRLLAAADDSQRASVVASAGPEIGDVARSLIARETPSARDAALFLLGWNEDALTQSYALCTLGEFASRANDRGKAAHLFDAATDLAKISDSCDAEATAKRLSAANTDDGEAKIALLKLVSDSADSLNDPRTALRALFDQARLLGTNLGALSRVADSLETLSRRYDSLDAALLAASLRANIGATVNDSTRAIYGYRQAIALASRTGDAMSEARAWANLGLAYNSMSEPVTAANAFCRAAALVEHDSNGTLIRSYANAWLGIELVQLGDVYGAENHLEAAFELPPDAKWSRVFPLLLLEMVRHEQGRLNDAIAAAREAIAIQPTALAMIWVLQRDLGDILVESGDLCGAVDAYRASIDLIEARRANSTSNAVIRARHFATRVPSYEGLQDTLLALGQFDDALAVAEQIKARSLTDSLAGAETGPMTPEEQKEHQTLTRNLLQANEAVIRASRGDDTKARQQQHAARAKLDAFEEHVAFRHAAFGNAVAVKGKPASIPKYRGVVIEYSIVGEAVVAFVVRDGAVTARRLDPVPQVESTAGELIDALDRRDLGYARYAAKLYSQIVAPLRDLLPPGGRLVLVPDDFLWRVPFASLQSEDGKFLMEKYAIAYAPSITEMRHAARLHRETAASEELLAIGNPLIAGETSKKAAQYRGLSLAPLPDAASEARSIAALYGRSHSTVLTGAAATETAVKARARNARILHLATHGLIDSELPLYSALVLSRRSSDPDDGLLEMREIARLHLNADLAVLSACDTADGAIYPGEGVIGMSWAFLRAGCTTTVVSQWNAASNSTSKLMIEFHRHLLRGEHVSEALRHAELTVMHDPRFRHPFYWAPFIVVGDDLPIAAR